MQLCLQLLGLVRAHGGRVVAGSATWPQTCCQPCQSVMQGGISTGKEGHKICLQGRLAAEALAVMESGGGPALRTGLEAPQIVIPRGNSASIAL